MYKNQPNCHKNWNPNWSINDTLNTCIVWKHHQICFHRQLFADTAKPCWCITRPVAPLGSTNQNGLGARLLLISVLIYPVVCVHSWCLLGTQHHCLWPNGREDLPSACPPTPTASSHHPLPYKQCPWYYTSCKNYLKSQQWILHGRISYETLAISLLYLYSIILSCMAIMQHRRTTAASIFQNGSHFLNTKCNNFVGFSKSDHI